MLLLISAHILTGKFSSFMNKFVQLLDNVLFDICISIIGQFIRAKKKDKIFLFLLSTLR